MLQYIYDLKWVNTSNELVVINHGGSEGIESDFIQKIKRKFTLSSTLLIQLPFKTRNKESTSGPEFKEELETYEEIFKIIRSLPNFKNITKIKFIGKSVGGLIQYHFIQNNYLWIEPLSVDLTLLGYLFDHTTINHDFNFPIHIIQGSIDPWCNLENVSNLVKKYSFIKLSVVEGGNHSFKNTKKEPVFQDLAISLI